MPMRMRTGLLVMLLLLTGTTLCAAKNLYIAEDFEVTARLGPGVDRKIIAMVPSGRLVELINAGEEWSEVRLPNGKEGFVLNRYLTDKPPSSILLARLETKHSELVNQYKEQQKKLSDLSAENNSLNAQLKQLQADVTSAQTNFENLKKNSAEFVRFKAEYDQNRKDLAEFREKAEKFETQLKNLAGSQLYEGMLYGGGLIVVGFLAGFVLKKPRKRSHLM